MFFHNNFLSLEASSEKLNEEKIDGKEGTLAKAKKKVDTKKSEGAGFVKTSFHSGHMASIILIYHRIRFWVKKAKKE